MSTLGYEHSHQLWWQETIYRDYMMSHSDLWWFWGSPAHFWTVSIYRWVHSTQITFFPLILSTSLCGGFCMIPISHVRKLRLLKINDNQKPTVNHKAGTQIQGFWHQIWYIFYKNSISFESKPVLPFLSGQIQCLTDCWVFWLGKSFPYPSILKQLSFWRHYIFIS